MLKAEVTKEFTKIEVIGDLRDICVDFTHILRAINERLSEKDSEAGHVFRVMFTKGFMDGVMFEDDREHMEHYLAEGDQIKDKNNEKTKEFVEFLDGFIDFLKDKKADLEKVKAGLDAKLDELSKENDDEAE